METTMLERLQRTDGVQLLDPVWDRVRAEAEEAARREPEIASFLFSTVLHHDRLEDAVAHRVAQRLGTSDVGAPIIRQAFDDAIEADAAIGAAFRADLAAVLDRDPACSRYLEPLLYFKGFQAIQTHRLAHWLWSVGRTDFALHLQSQSSAVFQVDINPTAKLGRALFFDHGTGIVIGATAVIGDDVSIMQGVTLGGTGKEKEDRHPKIGRGVLIGAGAKILGNIQVGHCSRIAAGSVVLQPVPPNVTMAGVPARMVGTAPCEEPARSMDHVLKDTN
jgi:serine O-acetyltransferase